MPINAIQPKTLLQSDLARDLRMLDHITQAAHLASQQNPPRNPARYVTRIWQYKHAAAGVVHLWLYVNNSHTHHLFHSKIRSRCKQVSKYCLAYVAYRHKSTKSPRPQFFRRMNQIIEILNTPDFSKRLPPNTILDPYSDPNLEPSQNVLSTILKNKIQKELTHGHPQD